MTEEQAKALRAEFPATAIGKLPKPTKKDNPKGRCQECGGYHGLPAVHLDYVGHAATTDRLLQVDPEWTWEPMAYGPNGEPLMANGGLWIWLTVGGVRRPGFGDGASPKEIIGDAIRNAAMRFGVALDLWAKEDLHAEEEVRNEDGGNVPVPRSWAEIRQLVDSSGVPTAWAVFEAYCRAFLYHQWGIEGEPTLDDSQREVFRQKAAGAAVWIAENDNTPVGGSWSRQHQQKGWAAVMDGALLEVPDLPKEDPPPPDPDAEAERLAEESLTGPES